MNVEDFFKRPGAWLTRGQGTNIAISSRIRLARNLKDRPFPVWAGAKERSLVWNQLKPILSNSSAMGECVAIGIDELSTLDKQIIFERHLISREHLEGAEGRGLVVSRDESMAIMVNEEDHLRVQSLRPGMDLRGAFECADKLDDEIDANVEYAFSRKHGYLTSCPTNVGTGMRASVMLHLPGLLIINEMHPIVKGLNKIGLAVRGLWGEGTEAVGNMFQVSNQMTLGKNEQEIIAQLEPIVHEIVEHEKNARIRLLEKKKAMIYDHIGRAYGLLAHAYLLNSKEALNLLSGVRLGVDLGIIRDVRPEIIDELVIQIQPAHLQKLVGKDLKPKQRDHARAELVRNRLSIRN